jgi:hypothetical protein
VPLSSRSQAQIPPHPGAEESTAMATQTALDLLLNMSAQRELGVEQSTDPAHLQGAPS